MRSLFSRPRISFSRSRDLSHPVPMIAGMTIEMEKLRLESLSPSRAGDFKTCPQLFYFRAIQRLPEPTSVHQARGTTAHLALQRLFDHPVAERTPARLFDLFRQAWTEVRGEEEFEGLFADLDAERAWGVESLKLLANYFTIEDPASIDPEDRELDMTEDLDGMVIRGILDRIDRALASERFPARPGRLCEWCSFQEICPAWSELEEKTA